MSKIIDALDTPSNDAQMPYLFCICKELLYILLIHKVYYFFEPLFFTFKI